MHGFEVDVESEGIRFRAYPFRAASVAREPYVAEQRILSVVANFVPPAVETRDGEFLFVPDPRRAALCDFAQARSLPLVHRGDVWDLLLEPFLDTEFEADHQARSLATLAKWGLDRARIKALRKRVESWMLLLTWASGEWHSYGLFDALVAMRLFRWPSRFAAFYQEAMEIARLGPEAPLTEDELRVFLSPPGNPA